MKQKKIVTKINEAANKIAKNKRHPDADRIFLTEEFIEDQSKELGVSFEEMCQIIQNEILPYEKK